MANKIILVRSCTAQNARIIYKYMLPVTYMLTTLYFHYNNNNNEVRNFFFLESNLKEQ